MSQKIERRQADRRSSDEELSAEYLALLDVCGGEIRASDRAVLAGRGQGAQAEARRSLEDRQPEGPKDALTAPDRRAGTS